MLGYPRPMLLAHVGHWIGQVLTIVPVLVVVAALAINWWRNRDDPRWYDREAEEAEQREIDEIVEGCSAWS